MFRYFSPATAAITERTVEPHHLRHYMGSWVLFAWCRLRNDWRWFFLARMEGPKLLAGTFEPRPAKTWRHLMDSGFGIFQAEKTFPVVLRFTPFMSRWIREQVWHPEQTIREMPEGGVELSFPAADLREVKLKVLQFGAEVEVVEPGELRDALREEIMRMKAIYG